MKTKLFILIMFLYLMPASALAADIYFEADKNISTGQDFIVEVFLDTRGIPANAVEGAVTIPTNLELKEIRDGNSAINFWIKRPTASDPGEVDFSGITAGGFSGPKVFLFSIVLEAKASGSYPFNFKNLLLLNNDGLGTKAAIKGVSTSLNVKSGTGAGDEKTPEDFNPPENFIPLLAEDESLFEGKHFAVFETVDKGSGMSHFEVRESFFGLGGTYQEAKSPYLILDQRLMRTIHIKAVDKAGNERIAKIGPQNWLIDLGKIVVFGIILLTCVYFGRKIWRRFFSH